MSNKNRFGGDQDPLADTGTSDSLTEGPSQPITTGGGTPITRGPSAESVDYPSTGGGTPIVKWPHEPE